MDFYEKRKKQNYDVIFVFEGDDSDNHQEIHSITRRVPISQFNLQNPNGNYTDTDEVFSASDTRAIPYGFSASRELLNSN